MIYSLDTKPLPADHGNIRVYSSYSGGHVTIETDGLEYPVWTDPVTGKMWIDVDGKAMVIII